MPCPLFIPASPAVCAGQPDHRPDPDVIRTCCKRGYAREQCTIAAGASTDAVTFLIRSDDANGIHVAWALERDHLPVAVGTANSENPNTGDTTLDAQIQAYAAVYRKSMKD